MKPSIDETLVSKAHELGPLIREHATEGERQRRLAKPVVEALDRAGLTRMYLPKGLGGLETDPVTGMRVVEEVSRFDAAAGWHLMVAGAGAISFARFPEATVDQLLADRDHWISAATVTQPLEAQEVEGGYRLNGRRPFASGVSTARWVMLTAMVMDGAQPRMIGGAPQVLIVVLPTTDVEVVDTWYGLGLRATDSNDVVVRDRFVPRAFTAPMVPTFEPSRHFRGPLYRMPILGPVVLAHIPPVAIALGRNAIEEVRALSARRVPLASMVPIRDRGTAQERLGRAEAMLRSARAFMYDVMAEAWERTKAGEASTLGQKADLMLAGAHAAQTGAKVVDMMFSSGGSSAVFDSQPLQRLFRDAQVIRQHGFVTAARYETFAQVSLGLEPDLPFLHF